jgi:hypothetical protein
MRGRTGVVSMLGAVVVSFALAGCGGKSGLTQAELSKQADAICTRHRDKISGAMNTLLADGKQPNAQTLRQFADQTLIPAYTAQLGELRKLKPKQGRGLKRYQKWVAASDAVRVKLSQDPALITNRASFAPVNGQADRLHLSSECHVGPS